MYIGTVKVGGREYVRVLKSERVDGMPRPRVVASLGNVETFKKSIPTIIRGLHRLLGEHGPEAEVELENLNHVEWGVTLAARALWRELNLTRKLRQCFRARKDPSPTEVLVRTMVTNRLSDPASKLGIVRWLDDVSLGEAEDGFLREHRGNPKALAQRFYEAMDSLLRHRAAIERHLFNRLKNLFNLEVDAVFYDLTSSYFEGTQAELGWFGYSRDERPGNLQVVVGLILVDGLPVSHQVFKGYRKDSTCLETALQRIERRFRIRRVILVGDRGFLTQDNIAMLRGKKYEYILACRKRRDKHTRKAYRAQPPVPVYTDQDAAGGKEPPPPVIWSLEASDGDRLVGYTNPASARRDRKRREEILEAFREELHDLQLRFRRSRHPKREERIKQVTELLVRRKKLGKRYFTAEVDRRGRLSFRAKQWVLKYEEKIDGTTILKTNNKEDPKRPNHTVLTDEEVVKRYKELARVERAFRDLKSFIDLRPIYHRKAERIAAHVFICMLALLLDRIMDRKLKAATIQDLTAEAALRALKRVRLLRDTVNGVEIERISRIGPEQERVLRALGVAPPSPLVTVRAKKPRKFK